MWSSIIRHGGITGISKASGQREACAAINAFLKDKFANRTWTSIAVLRNPKIGLHRDVCNLAGHLNHAGKTFTMKDCHLTQGVTIKLNLMKDACGHWQPLHRLFAESQMHMPRTCFH